MNLIDVDQEDSCQIHKMSRNFEINIQKANSKKKKREIKEIQNKRSQRKEEQKKTRFMFSQSSNDLNKALPNFNIPFRQEEFNLENWLNYSDMLEDSWIGNDASIATQDLDNLKENIDSVFKKVKKFESKVKNKNKKNIIR